MTTPALYTAFQPGMSGASPMGVADLSFQSGIAMEKCGEARAAQAAFHEAATLYQCFLEQIKKSNHTTTTSVMTGNEFSYVTNMGSNDEEKIRSILAYICIRLAHLSHDFGGDSKAAARLYKEATTIDPHPSSIAYDGYGAAIEASGGDLNEAVAAYRKALAIRPNSHTVSFHLAVALERLGKVDESQSIMENLRRGEAQTSCLVDSWGYVRWHTRKVKPPEKNNVLRGTREMMEIALDAALDIIVDENGLVCEFGVASGRSIRMAQEVLPLNVSIYGFDTFTGLPQAWGNEPAGTYSTGGIVPNLEGEVTFLKGLFKDTIPAFLEAMGSYRPLAFANIDCDLYSSTYDVLEGLHGRIVPGTILLFDEYLGHPTWRQDEFRAWRECCKRFGWRYEYLAFSLASKQTVVRVIDA